MRILVIGAVAGGTGAATKARRNNEQAEIVIYEKDEYISYSGCAMPYYISGEITSDEDLAPRNPKFFKDNYNIDVKILHEVVSINPANKTITVKNLKTNEEFIDSYDKLVIATGARSAFPPIKGLDKSHVFGLRNMKDMYAIKEFINKNSPKKAVVIGAGFIGIEVVESFIHLGMDVTLVERLDQVSPGLDKDMADYVQDILVENKVKVLTSASASEITEKHVLLADGTTLESDIVIVATGVRPNTEIAVEAGIEIGNFRAIKVNKYMQTNINDIFACGDCTEQYHQITNKAVYRPLGSTANKTARIVGDNITGKEVEFKGVLGTSIYRVFGKAVAQTGLTEREARAEGYDIEIIHNIKPNKPSYMHGEKMIIKGIADRKTGQFLGAQIIGFEGVDKRIDVFATAITFKATVEDLFHLDLAYAPPYNTAKDPVHYTGMILDNAISKSRRLITPSELDKKNDDILIIDTRPQGKYKKNHLPNAINIPLEKIRTELSSINKDKMIVTYCGMGLTSNAVQNILINNGFKNAYNLSGGYENYTKTCLINKDNSESH